jgi:hypothetical protein
MPAEAGKILASSEIVRQILSRLSRGEFPPWGHVGNQNTAVTLDLRGAMLSHAGGDAKETHVSARFTRSFVRSARKDQRVATTPHVSEKNK